METWWSALSGSEQFFWVIAIISTIFLLCQFAMLLLGLDDQHDGSADTDADFDGHVDGHDHDGDHDHDAGHHGLALKSFFSIRSLVAFFLGFSWGGLGCLESGLSLSAAVAIGIVIGIVMAAVVLSIFAVLSGLRNSGTLSFKNAIGQKGTVLIMVPARKNGYGKVRVTVQGRLCDLTAVTDGNEDLPRGTSITVKEVKGDSLVVVKDQ